MKKKNKIQGKSFENGKANRKHKFKYKFLATQKWSDVWSFK